MVVDSKNCPECGAPLGNGKISKLLRFFSKLVCVVCGYEE